MTDQCDIDTLMAYIDEPDDEFGNTKEEKTQNNQCDIDTLMACIDEPDDECGHTKEENIQNSDECNEDEIRAFLEGSDDEGDDESSNPQGEIQTNTEESSKESQQSKEAEENEFSDMEDLDLDEINNMETSQICPQSSQSQQESQDGCAGNSHEHDDLVDEKEAINHEDKDNDNDDNSVDNVDNEDDNDKELDEDEEESEANLSAHDAIKAEMAAMAERMKQLQDMLEKNTPKSKEKKENSKKKSNSINKEKTNTTSSPSSSKTSSKSFQTKGNVSQQNANFDSGKNRSKEVKDRKDFSSKPIAAQGSKTIEAQGSKTLAAHGKKEKVDKVQSSSSSSNKKTFMTSTKPSMSSPAPRPPEKKFQRKEEDDTNPFFGETQDQRSGVKVTSRSVFGDSDDSDWEDLGGEEKSKLSDQGKELKKLINSGTKKREAHTPKYDPAILKKPNVSTWTGVSSKPATTTFNLPKSEMEKPKLNPETGTVSGKYRVKDEYRPKVDVPKSYDNREFVQDPYCGIRIVNPRISMESFKTKMDGRSMVRIPKLMSKNGVNDLQKDNWVTLGVVVHKTEPRQSANGKTYCIWKLSDLTNCDQAVTFFLFSNVYKEHWKNETGVVIGLLNPSIMDKAEKAQSELALTINHPQQLLIMGTSKDLGRCKGTTKAGAMCSNFINKTQGDFCTYHVQSAYRKSSSKRTELQASTGKAPKAFEQKKKMGPNSTAGCFFYAGQTFTTMQPRTANTKDKVTLKKLQTMEAGKEAGKLTTMSLHELRPEDTQKLQKIREKDKQLPWRLIKKWGS